MDIATFRTLVTEAKSAHPGWFMLPSDASASEADLELAESSLGLQIPDDYRAFLLEYGGGDFAFMNVFSATPGSDWGIVERNAMAALPAGRFLAISDDETGGLYGYRVEAGSLAGICYLDLSTGEVAQTKYPNALALIAALGLRHRTEHS